MVYSQSLRAQIPICQIPNYLKLKGLQFSWSEYKSNYGVGELDFWIEFENRGDSLYIPTTHSQTLERINIYGLPIIYCGPHFIHSRTLIRENLQPLLSWRLLFVLTLNWIEDWTTEGQVVWGWARHNRTNLQIIISGLNEREQKRNVSKVKSSGTSQTTFSPNPNPSIHSRVGSFNHRELHIISSNI